MLSLQRFNLNFFNKYNQSVIDNQLLIIFLSLPLPLSEPGHTGLYTRRPADPLAARAAAVSADALLRSQAEEAKRPALPELFPGHNHADDLRGHWTR